MQSHPKYRADIDGLRAVAVLSVIGFHAFPYWLTGGFIGVDVFFVISGFLISTIIMGSLDGKRFSYLDFYGRRIRRIFPALLLVLGCSLALGWLILLPDEYEQLAKHVVGGTTYVSNFILWNESGYFDLTAEAKPMLHLWSLGIEEQFYIVWPLLLGLIWRQRWNFLKIALALAAASFLLNVYFAERNLTIAFYSPLTRFWELMAGGVLAHLLRHHAVTLQRARQWQSVAGLVCLALALALLDKTSKFPGWWALLPVVGTCLLISAGPDAWCNKQLLTRKPLVWVGLISYPLYLWHWPLLSFARIVEGHTPSRQIRAWAVAVSFVAAYATYRWVERRFRQGPNLHFKAAGLVSLSVLLMTAGAVIDVGQGMPARAITTQGDNLALAAAMNRQANFPAGVTSCADDAAIAMKLKQFCEKYSVGAGRRNIVVWGDSSAGAWSSVFYRLGQLRDINVYVISHPSCPPLLGVRKSFHHHPASRAYCSDGQLGAAIVANLRALNPQYVFLIGAWNGYTHYADEQSPMNEYITTDTAASAGPASSIAAMKQQLPKTIESLDAFSKLVVFRPWPTLLAEPNNRIQRFDFLQPPPPVPLKTSAQHDQESAVISSILQSLSAGGTTRQTVYFDPAGLVCSEQCSISIAKVPLYDRDSYHITPAGALLFQPTLEKLLQSMGH